MKEKQGKKHSAWNYLWLALEAFLGVGFEVLVLMAEQAVYGVELREFNELQSVFHWIFTCLIWGEFAYILTRTSKKRYNFDLMGPTEPQEARLILIALGLLIVGIIENTISWHGFKPWMEFQNKSVVKFIFQYIYYLFESALFVLILMFGQKFGETKFGHKAIPYGGIVLALTWGMAHFLSQDFICGIETVTFSILFGIIHLCVKRNAKLTYLFCACIFML